MARAQQGDKAAYESLVRRLQPLLLRVARRKWHGASADPEDLVQDVLLSLHEAIGHYDPARPFLPWLFSIFRHRLGDLARWRSRHAGPEMPLDTDMPLPEPFHDPDRLIDGATARTAVSLLAAGQRQAIDLLILGDLPAADASRVAGRSQSALRVAAHKGIGTLRRRLNPPHP